MYTYTEDVSLAIVVEGGGESYLGLGIDGVVEGQCDGETNLFLSCYQEHMHLALQHLCLQLMAHL